MLSSGLKMMVVYKYICTILIVFLFGCCNSAKQSDQNTSTLYLRLPEKGEDTLKASYFADTVLYIPLETIDESLITFIKQVWTNDSLLLINSWQRGLLLFTMDGSFIRRIGKIGSGPGEYLEIFHFDVINDTIIISSKGKGGFMRFLFDGNFCDEIHTNYHTEYFGSTSDNELVSYINLEGKLLIYDLGWQNIDTIFIENGITNGRYYYLSADNFMTYLQKTPTGLLFNSYRSDTIWRIEKNKKIPAYVLQGVNELLLPYGKQVEFCNGDFKKWERNAKSYCYFKFMPCDAYTFIVQHYYTSNRLSAFYIYNNSTGEFRRFNTWFIYDDITGKTKLNFIFPFISNKYIIADWSWANIKNSENETSQNLNRPSERYLNQMQKIKEDDNPILVLMKLKSNSR